MDGPAKQIELKQRSMERIRKGWNFIRVIYLIAGVGIMIQSLISRQWALALFGLYFTFMGLLGLGCAGGGCYAPPAASKNKQINTTEFEEIK